jgi:gliding motility-associated protein GldL
MGLNNIVKGRGFKNFMAKLYGWGASIVILGALFKINHYQGADIMLIIGLGTESLIFFFSAFEPPHVEPDWSLVYPELAGMYHGVTTDIEDGRPKKEGLTGDLDKMLSDAKIGPELIQSLGKGLKNLSDNTHKLTDVTDAAFITNAFTEKVKGATASVKNLTESYDKQSQTIQNDINVSEGLVSSVKNVSENASKLSDSYAKASQSISNDLGTTQGFAESMKAVTQSANNLARNYTKSSEIISQSVEALDFTQIKEANYAEQLLKISKNLASLNNVYEQQLKNSQLQSETSGKLNVKFEEFVNNLNHSIDNTTKYKDNISALNSVFQNQLKGTSDQIETTQKLQKSLDEFLKKINDSADKTLKYNEELDNLAKKVAALNTVYGNMLSAMNVKS